MSRLPPSPLSPRRKPPPEPLVTPFLSPPPSASPIPFPTPYVTPPTSSALPAFAATQTSPSPRAPLVPPHSPTSLDSHEPPADSHLTAVTDESTRPILRRATDEGRDDDALALGGAVGSYFPPQPAPSHPPERVSRASIDSADSASSRHSLVSAHSRRGSGDAAGASAAAAAYTHAVASASRSSDRLSPLQPRADASGYEKVAQRASGCHMDERRVSEDVDDSGRTLATRTEKLYMAVASVVAIVVVGVAFAVFAIVQVRVTSTNAKTRTTPVYLAIFILAQIFSVAYTFDALRARNVVQVLLHIFFQTAILTYAILQPLQTRNTLAGANLPSVCAETASGYDCTGSGSLFSLLVKLMVWPPIAIGIGEIVSIYLCRKLYIEFGWSVFHLVGASVQLKRMHRQYQCLVSLLKLLAFFGTAFCMAYVILVSDFSSHPVEFIITIVALPLALASMLLCGWALRHENKAIMGFCLFLMTAGLAYFIYKTASMWLPTTADLYSNTRITMAIFSIFSTIILLATFVNGCLCMSNFDRGLVQTHQNPENKTSLWSLQPKQSEKQQRPDTQLIID
ncbi:hypothetical protein Q5752_006861 [Cryptotrichosporon argae]